MSPQASNLLDLRIEGPIAFLKLDDGRGNALGRPMLEALERALAEAAHARVLVLSGREKIFCGGLDLPALVSLDRAQTRAFIDLFDRVLERLLAYPRPIVTAARGSAIAGGAMLLCAGDDRLVTPQGKVGINEVALGLCFPTGPLEIVRCALGERSLAEAALSGRIYEGDDRLRLGFATEVVSAEALEARARALAAEWARLDPETLARVRLQVRRASLARVVAHAAEDREAFLDRWFAPAAQEQLRATVERLRAPSGATAPPGGQA